MLRLGHEHPVEGVAVNRRQASRRNGVLGVAGRFTLVGQRREHSGELRVSSPQREESVEDCAVRERVRALAGLAEEIRDRPCAQAVRLVAVDGRGGAGKSTLARALAAACGGAPVVRVDDFLYWRDIEGWWPRLEREALRPLLSGLPARFRARDWANDPAGPGPGQMGHDPSR